MNFGQVYGIVIFANEILERSFFFIIIRLKLASFYGAEFL